MSIVKFTDNDTIKAFVTMGASQNVAASFVELSHAMSEGKIVPKSIDPEKPNVPTMFADFVQEVFVNVYKYS